MKLFIERFPLFDSDEVDIVLSHLNVSAKINDIVCNFGSYKLECLIEQDFVYFLLWYND